jgi:hypothetical protein
VVLESCRIDNSLPCSPVVAMTHVVNVVLVVGFAVNPEDFCIGA